MKIVTRSSFKIFYLYLGLSNFCQFLLKTSLTKWIGISVPLSQWHLAQYFFDVGMKVAGITQKYKTYVSSSCKLFTGTEFSHILLMLVR